MLLGNKIDINNPQIENLKTQVTHNLYALFQIKQKKL